jgi:ketosteroid isomerase-like protein
MSQENVEVVRKSLQTIEGDPETWLGTLDPALEWYPIEDGNHVSHGHQGALAIRERWLESFEDNRVEVEEIRDAGEHVVASLHISGSGTASGIDVDLRVHVHWKVRGGRVVYVFEYADRAEALEAAGLRE